MKTSEEVTSIWFHRRFEFDHDAKAVQGHVSFLDDNSTACGLPENFTRNSSAVKNKKDMIINCPVCLEIYRRVRATGITTI